MMELEDIKKAVKHLILKEKTIAEPAGAIGVAAVLADPTFFEGKNVAIVITAGNIDEDLMVDLLNEN